MRRSAIKMKLDKWSKERIPRRYRFKIKGEMKFFKKV